MTIETKHNVGDRVWIIMDGKLRNVRIKTVYTTSFNSYVPDCEFYKNGFRKKVAYEWSDDSMRLGDKTVDEENCWATVDDFVNKSLDI